MRNQSTLLQKIRYMTMITWISFLISPDTALASTAQDIAAASDGLVWESQGALVSRATKEGEFVPGFEHAVTTAVGSYVQFLYCVVSRKHYFIGVFHCLKFS